MEPLQDHARPTHRKPSEEPAPPWAQPLVDEPGTGTLALETARAWVEANQTVAVLGAFALGVFLGVLMRR